MLREKYLLVKEDAYGMTCWSGNWHLAKDQLSFSRKLSGLANGKKSNITIQQYNSRFIGTTIFK
jgi:hypothetical protein